MTLFDLAQRYVGIREIAGERDHPLIKWWLSLCFDGNFNLHDETPWCSAFLNGMAWELRLPRSKSAMARSWLRVGVPVALPVARVGYDVVILWRDSPEGILGHVGLLAGRADAAAPASVLLLGGNQHDGVSIAPFPASQVLGVRRLQEG